MANRLHLELDGAECIALIDGEPQPGLAGLLVELDGPAQLQEVALTRAILMDGRVYLSSESYTITKLTITAEIQEATE